MIFFPLSSFSSFLCSSKRCWKYRKAVLEVQKQHRDQEGDVQHVGCHWPQHCYLLHGEHPMQQQKKGLMQTLSSSPPPSSPRPEKSCDLMHFWVPSPAALTPVFSWMLHGASWERKVTRNKSLPQGCGVQELLRAGGVRFGGWAVVLLHY